MNGFVTTNRFDRVLDLPITFAQTELRSAKAIYLAKFVVSRNTRIEIRSLTLTVAAILTPDIVPLYLNTAMELCSVGVYRGIMVTGPLAYAAFKESTAMTNPFSPCVIETPGTYNVIVSNNTSNTDLSVVATGSIKLYY